MASGLHVVLGATGHVGSVVAARLLDAGRRVRVVGRSSEKLASFVSRGAESAVGTVEDPAFLRRTFEGTEAAFVLLPPYLGKGVRAWQDRTASTIADALETARVPWVVMLSSIGADLSSDNGPVAGLHVLEKGLARIRGLSPLFLRPGYFFENHLGAIGLIRAMGMNGGGLRGDLKMVHVASRDIGEVAARRLLALDWNGRTVQELHGERDLTMSEVTAALGKAIGRPELRYAQLPYADAQAGMVQAGIPEENAALYTDMSKGFNEGKVKPTQPRTPASTTPTSIERWAAEIFVPVYAASAPREATEEAAVGHA
jgi:uncharacterized protein YbjT (DUF2867 family)